MGIQRGLSLVNLIIGLALLGFAAIMVAKTLPAYNEYWGVKKIFATMEQAGTLKGTVREIRYQFEKLNAIEDIKSIRGEDLEVTKEGGETVRMRIGDGWDVDIYKTMILAVEEDAMVLLPA